jgi:hypothetical protein
MVDFSDVEKVDFWIDAQFRGAKCNSWERIKKELAKIRNSSHNSASRAIATCALCQCELDRSAVCHSCWVAGPPSQRHA